ncbi:hypothetical protein [Candidatus Methanomethylophilus sp. 1R26]|uniref:hypothetical protein n=1 Tax=Candidatus Methanomethylophilus sp. 1R26 TaxID=1769296 RepID=UPI0012FE9026|nr:hypothetical protein [Candidatus Methanomethylophilus sp. 1R26]
MILDQRRFENNTTYVELTARGREVAKKLVEIEGILSDDPPEPEDSYDSSSVGAHTMPL